VAAALAFIRQYSVLGICSSLGAVVKSNWNLSERLLHALPTKPHYLGTLFDPYSKHNWPSARFIVMMARRHAIAGIRFWHRLHTSSRGIGKSYQI
jgi:hypothetical protein